jgi:type IV secretory pathway TraG/TraD family ATPase VirD4
LSNDQQPPSFWDLFTKSQSSEEESGPSFWSLFTKDEPASEPVPPAEPPMPIAPPETFFWAMRDLPVTEAMKHFLICGATGTGKTLTIKLFLRSIANRFKGGKSTPEQLIVFDAKGDMAPILAEMGLFVDAPNVHVLNPYDERSSVWSLGEATQTPVMARAVAALLIPEERNTTAPYFADAARELVYAVLLSLNKIAGTKWDLRDLLCAMDSSDNITDVTKGDPRAKRIASRILGDKHHGPAVLSTLGTKLGRFDQVAALWHTSPRPKLFSIQEFLKEPGVLVLGNDPMLRESFWPINAMLLQALTNEILRQEETRTPRHWFVLDEMRAMEKLTCIGELLNRGRSKGAAVMIGIQSVEGLFDVYGDHAANDLLGQCGHKTFLRAGSHRTAEWAAQHFGKVRQQETSRSQTSSFEGRSSTVSWFLQERDMFLPSYFLDLPFPGLGGSYVAVCDVPFTGEVLIVERSFQEILRDIQGPSEIGVPGLIPRTDMKNQSLYPWTEEEKGRFFAEAGDQPGGPPAKPDDPDNDLPLRHEF